MKKQLALIGGGGHGKVCAAIAEELDFAVYFFDDAYPSITECGKWSVIGTSNDLIGRNDVFEFVFVAIGNCLIRERIQKKFVAAGFNIASLVSPSSTVHSSVKIGDGVLVVGNACINIDSVIGDGVIINTNASVDHDCTIGSFSHICPNVALSGDVKVGQGTWVGLGSSVIQQINIGEYSIIGAGSVVVNNIGNYIKAFGVPAKKICNL